MPLPPLKRVPGHEGIATDPQGRYWVRIKLGRRTVRELRNSLEDARQRRDVLRVEYRKQIAVPGHRDYVKPGRTLLAAYIERMWSQLRDEREEGESYKGLSMSTVRRYKVSEKALTRLLGKFCFLDEITPAVVETFRKARRREVEPATVNRDLTRLNTILSQAVKEGFLAEVPFEFAKEKYREPEGRLRFLSEHEEDELMLAADFALKPMIQFALLTGFRLNEQLKLTWQAVHRTRIHLSGSQTKTHRRRIVPITDKIRLLLNEQRGKSKTWVFPNRTGSNHWDAQNLYRDLWNPARDRAGLIDFRWHDLRHTFCSRLVQRGANIVAVKELAGHRSIEITMRYVHLSPDHLVSTMNLL